MAWNKPSPNRQFVGIGKPNRSVGRVILRAFIAIAVAIFGIVAWQVFRQTEETDTEVPQKKTSLIKQAVPVVKKEEVIVQTNKWPERSPHPDGKWRHGEGPRSIAVTNGCLVTYPHCPNVQLILPHPAFAAPFDNISDNEIARILRTKPGDSFIDDPLPRDFDQRFANSMLSPIEINDDDPPETVELKSQVKEARKILLQALKNGESPRQILMDEAKNIRKLMRIKDNYQQMVKDQIESGATDQEINDTVNAANKLLEQSGISSKIRLPYKTKLRIDSEKKKGNVID